MSINNFNTTAVMYTTQGSYMHWATYKGPSYDIYALSSSNVNGTMPADILFCDHYYCENKWYKLEDVPENREFQITIGYKVSGVLHALATDEQTGLLALEVPNDDKRKFFTAVKSDKGTRLRSCATNKMVEAKGNFFYATAAYGGYDFISH
ncbi:hypothetical protein CONCODRAFT_3549 [Conidiobolus coronatus NRRL 28638]|uniref:Uncharacterized protein n=1 Tax=Conidiobolus coronatus (strain ATCC 28846 / CBS 209.66 / NRRL 28638) TaxID=796925 RepID=A0A137PEM1_CONC2|nr:hypothetical protein CONCODRAFT_3549 [Conidiobolus coronatus NRRL 28638]|eukprot:KXN73449.1 hypothetical protein CONCODRAFT_3549 [Conidiobolus coronatus NRRL 28638]